MFMGNDVVDIVISRALVCPWSNNLSGNEFGRYRSKSAIFFLGRELQYRVHLLGRDFVCLLLCGLGYLENRFFKLDDLVARRVVTRRVKNLRANHVGGRRSLRLKVVIEFQQVASAVAGVDPKAGSLPIELGADHRPGLRWVKRRTPARAARNLLRSELGLPKSILEPARVRHLVQRVDVQRLPAVIDRKEVDDRVEDAGSDPFPNQW